MKRNEFLKTSVILSGASLLPVNSVFSNSLAENGMDKLVDANGNGRGNPEPALYFSSWRSG